MRKAWYENQEFIKEKTEKLKGKPYQTETNILGLSTDRGLTFFIDKDPLESLKK